MNTMDILKEKLRETGFKITPQRESCNRHFIKT